MHAWYKATAIDAVHPGVEIRRLHEMLKAVETMHAAEKPDGRFVKASRSTYDDEVKNLKARLIKEFGIGDGTMGATVFGSSQSLRCLNSLSKNIRVTK